MGEIRDWIGRTLRKSLNPTQPRRQVMSLKSHREIGLMREAGRVVAQALDKVRVAVVPGVTTGELNRIVVEHFEKVNAVSLFKGVPSTMKGKPAFPAVVCASVNEEVVHGLPGSRVLKEGDVISIDTGCRLNGWCGDSAYTFAVGRVSQDRQRLLDVTRGTLDLAIERMKTARSWLEVATDMERYVRDHGMAVIEQFVGHGIGQNMHEEPQVPNYVSDTLRKQDFLLEPGVVLAIEPMVALGTKNVRVLSDGWTVETTDHKAAAHFEHTVAMTESGPRVLTFLDGD
ncbi:MAG: type I methionyl aminopeptidase [bacterium]